MKNRLLRIITSGVLVCLAAAHAVFPTVIDGITLGFLALAMVPWLSPIIKSLKIPGLGEIELQELQNATRAMAEAGLVVEAQHDKPTEGELPGYMVVAQSDPNLALAGLRIEIERRLRKLAEVSGMPPSRPPTIKRLLNDLDKHQVIFLHDREAIGLLVQTLNAAVHGAGVGDSAASWAMDVGPRILSGLDERIVREARNENQTND